MEFFFPVIVTCRPSIEIGSGVSQKNAPPDAESAVL